MEFETPKSLNKFTKPEGKDKKNKHIKSQALSILEGLALADLKAKFPNFPYPPKPKYKDSTSNGLTKCVIDFITFSGYQAERINSTGRQIDNRKTTTDAIGRTRTVGSIEWIKGTTTNGTADISATIKGKSVKIEVKCKGSGDNKQSKDQIKYQKAIEKAGGAYVIARDFEGFYKWFQNFVSNG